MDQSVIKISFVNPLHLYRMKEEIPSIITDQMKKDHTSKLGMGTGWSGPKTLFDDARAWMIHDEIEAIAKKEVSEAWINIMRFGDRIGPHSHNNPDNETAGVLYLVADSCCPPIIFHTGEHSNTLHRIYSLHCIYSGMVLTFPANMIHEVPVQTCHCSRISVAFNVKK